MGPRVRRQSMWLPLSKSLEVCCRGLAAVQRIIERALLGLSNIPRQSWSTSQGQLNPVFPSPSQLQTMRMPAASEVMHHDEMDTRLCDPAYSVYPTLI
jgi:hypothetical protein